MEAKLRLLLLGTWQGAPYFIPLSRHQQLIKPKGLFFQLKQMNIPKQSIVEDSLFMSRDFSGSG
jgi:hypothetical protein